MTSAPARRARLGAAALALALFAPACDRAPEGDPRVAYAVDVAPRPPSVGPTAVLVRLTTAEGGPVEGARLSLEATMSHAGMVPELAELAEVEPGLYRAQIELTMGGDWILLFSGTLADGSAASHVHHLPGVEVERG